MRMVVSLTLFRGGLSLSWWKNGGAALLREDPYKIPMRTLALRRSVCPPPPAQLLEFSKLDRLFANKELRFLMVGLNGAGKTTILENICNVGIGDIVTTTPTLGFTVETLKYKNTSLTVWDLEGDDRVRALWRPYYHNIQGIIFVVDCTDRNRVDEARHELYRILNEDELKDAVLLEYANENEVQESMLYTEVANKPDLKSLYGRRIWRVIPICAILGQQIYRGLSWLSEKIADKANSS